jgi:hypothetical protein
MGTKVKCIKQDSTGYLTQGNVYEATQEGALDYEVVDDEGDLMWFSKGLFEEVKEGAKDTQVGGNHYTKCGIQPYEYTLANNLGGLEHTVVKYVTRWKDKGGVEDLKKARHTLDFLIAYTEEKNNG